MDTYLAVIRSDSNNQTTIIPYTKRQIELNLLKSLDFTFIHKL